jgi:uncharacterized protein YukE
MVFRVYPPALRAAAAALYGDAEAAQVAKRYAAAHGDMDWHAEGAMLTIIGAHQDFVARLDKRLGHLVDLLAATGAELVDSASYYQHTDRAAAATIDATYPAVARIDPDPD